MHSNNLSCPCVKTCLYVTNLLTMVLVKSCFVGEFICWQTFLNVPTLERRRPPCNSSSKRDNAAKAGASFNPFHGQGLFSRWRLSYLTIQESLETLKSCIRWSNNLKTVLYIFIHPAPIWSNLSQPKCTKLVTAHKPIIFCGQRFDNDIFENGWKTIPIQTKP